MGERRERVKPEDASDYIALAFEHWRDSCGDDTYDLNTAESETLAFLAQVEADRDAFARLAATWMGEAMLLGRSIPGDLCDWVQGTLDVAEAYEHDNILDLTRATIEQHGVRRGS